MLRQSAKLFWGNFPQFCASIRLDYRWLPLFFLKISHFAAQRSSISSINLMALLVKEIFSFSWCFSLVLMNYGAVWADTATNWAEINEICGISYADRIVGGTRASIGQFPWIAHVGIVREYPKSTHGNSAWVMTGKNGSVQDLFYM